MLTEFFHVGYSSDMFVKLNRSGGRVYAQLAEAFRDDAGNPRNRVIATLGRVDKDDPNINSVLAGLRQGGNQGCRLIVTLCVI